jgi:hypothetical protein
MPRNGGNISGHVLEARSRIYTCSFSSSILTCLSKPLTRKCPKIVLHQHSVIHISYPFPLFFLIGCSSTHQDAESSSIKIKQRFSLHRCSHMYNRARIGNVNDAFMSNLSSIKYFLLNSFCLNGFSALRSTSSRFYKFCLGFSLNQFYINGSNSWFLVKWL